MFLAMSPKFKPWDNTLLRQAVGYAIDRDTIIGTILKGQATRLDGPIGPGQYGYDLQLRPRYEFNPEKARQFVKQAGFANGVDVELSTPVNRYTLDKQISEAMVPMLNAVGIRAKLQTPEWATLWANVQQGKVPFYYMGRGGIIDPSPAISQYFETGGSPRIGYSNAQLDKLLSQERQTFDPAKRKRVLAQAMSLITEDAPAHFLWRHRLTDGVSRLEISEATSAAINSPLVSARTDSSRAKETAAPPRCRTSTATRSRGGSVPGIGRAC
jgi:peptide/nickel transport system substrate-binding protein